MPRPARFCDGERAVVHEVEVRPEGEALAIVRCADRVVLARWPIAEIVLLGDRAHEAAPPVARAGGDARLVVEDDGQRRQLAAWVPALAALARPAPPPGARLAGFGVALVALVGLFWGAVDWGSEHAAPLLPHGLQARLGETVYDELAGDRQECRGQPGLAVLDALANRMAQAAGYPHRVTVHVLKGGPVNAYTLPGGILVFQSELIEKAKDGSQVAGVLAHEIGHVVHYHPTRGLVRQAGLELIARLIGGGYSDIASTLGSGGTLLLALRNGRAFERDADATGVALLEKLGLRADGVASFFEQMMAGQPGDKAAAAGIWSSHPPTAERIEATRRPPVGRPAFSEAEWRALRAVCR